MNIDSLQNPSEPLHILFVEGDSNSIDATVLVALLDGQLSIQPLGSCFSVRNVAKALTSNHPRYYFLVDRDYYSDAEVEASWANFPDPNTDNLLIWRRRELENYFIIPGYVKLSPFLKVSEDELYARILEESQKRLYI